MKNHEHRHKSAQHNAVAPASQKVAQRDDTVVTQAANTGGKPVGVPAAKSFGRLLMDCLANQMVGYVGGCRVRGLPHADGCSEAVMALCARLLAGERDSDIAAQLQASPLVNEGPYHMQDIAHVIADMLARPETPALVCMDTFKGTRYFNVPIIQRLERCGEIHAIRGQDERLYYDAADLEAAIRRRYNGNLESFDELRFCLLEVKGGAEASSRETLGVDHETLMHLITSGLLPTIRLGDTEGMFLLFDLHLCARVITALRQPACSAMDVAMASFGNWQLAACALFICHSSDRYGTSSGLAGRGHGRDLGPDFTQIVEN